MRWWPFQNIPSIKTSIGEFVHAIKHNFPSDNLEAYAKEGYAENPTVYACIKLVAESMASIPLRVKVNGELVEDHPLERLLEQPNPDEGGIEFRIAAASWLLMAGNCYTQKLMSGKTPTQLMNWQPYNFSITRRLGNPLPLRYTYAKNQQHERNFDVDPISGKSEIMHWRTFNPSKSSGEFGQAPLKAAASCVDSANASRLWNYSTTQNSGSASILVTSEQEITPKQQQQLEQNLVEKWMGPKNANKIKVMGSATKVQTISMTPKDMEWLNGLKLNAQEICSVFGVPTQLLGIEGSQTYANYAEAKVAFYTQAVMPLLNLYISELNRFLSPDFGDSVEICYNKDDIDALEPLRREARAEKLATNVLTINEKRALLGYDRIEEDDADALFVSPQDIPLGLSMYDEPMTVADGKSIQVKGSDGPTKN
jgi:HK97 family phage portal protein